MILDSTAKSLEVVLGGQPATNQLPVVCSWADITATTFTAGSSDTVTNGTTPVTIVSAPASSTQRQVKEILVYNADTEDATVKVRYNNDSTIRQLVQATLKPGESLCYREGMGWMTLNTYGGIKTSENAIWVKAKAYRSSSQSIPSGSSWTKVGINTVVYDSNNIVDTANNRITPDKSGYYIVYGQASLSTSGAGNVVTQLRKNGSAIARGSRASSSSGEYLASNVTDIIYFNGSSDYVELYVVATAGGNLEISALNNYLEVLGPF
jgi:hypothetical protein